MKVVVDFDRCESNAVCMGIAPEVFEVRDDDFLYVLQEHPPEELRPKIEEAVRLVRSRRSASRTIEMASDEFTTLISLIKANFAPLSNAGLSAAELA